MSKGHTYTKQTPRIVFGAPASGSGKTTVTLAVMAALKKRGLVVQGFKCGPDYIDPGYHRAITGRSSRNLDSWFVKPAIIRQIFSRNSADADLSIIEGVMGLFDGRNPGDNEGSTAQIASIIDAPVILVIDARSQARSAAALVRGFQVFSKKTNIAGVIVNKYGSAGHLQLLREAIEKECGIPVLGGFPRMEEIQIPERQLGLLPAIERGELDSLFGKLAQLAENNLDLDRLIQIAQRSQKKQLGEVSGSGNSQHWLSLKCRDKTPVAVAYDDAFNFYYQENFEIMRDAGMEIRYFSPLKNEVIPSDACGLYLGGGFPEEFARTLSKNHRSMNSIRAVIENGMPSIAECGGYMYLTSAIVDTRGKRFPMAGILPGEVVMQNRLASLGYREISGLAGNFLVTSDEVIRGHEFHYSTIIGPVDASFLPAYHIQGRNVNTDSGFIFKNLIAGYMHFYFLSKPSVVQRWAEKCRQYKIRIDAI